MNTENTNITGEFAYENYENNYAEIVVTYYLQSRLLIDVDHGKANIVLGLEDAKQLADEIYSKIKIITNRLTDDGRK